MNENLSIALVTLLSGIGAIAVFIAILYLLCTGIKNQVAKHNPLRIAIYIVITLLIFWPVAIGQGIYVILKWSDPVDREKRRKCNEICDEVNEIEKDLNQKNAEFEAEYKSTKKPIYIDDYERWKAKRLAEQKEEP